MIAWLAIATMGSTTPDTSDWFAWDAYDPSATPVWDASALMHRPAGKHGFLQEDGDDLRFQDGTKAVLWGTNASNLWVAPERDDAEKTADMIVRYGMNGLRLHKWTWGKDDPRGRGITTSESVLEVDPELGDRFDYFHHALKERGVYTGWSHIYGTRPKPADLHRLRFPGEVVDEEVTSHLSRTTSFLVNWAPDMQQLNIDLTVMLLNRVNPYTGLRYADDPALAFVELQNEDNIYWGSHHSWLETRPGYRGWLSELFSDWLWVKYGSEEAWLAAWEGDTIEGESLLERNVYPEPSHGVFDYHWRRVFTEGIPLTQRRLDQMRFLYERQMEFYAKFVAAVRSTGYEGVIVTTPWQAGSGPAHFYNLHADATFGMVDRHNYYGPGTGLNPQGGPATSMLARPGTGVLSTGLQQVAGRPFSISEWTTTNPFVWAADSHPLVAAYGMGLQGWDASFSFAFDSHGFLDTLGHPWNVRNPRFLGQYPTLSRMALRGDVTEAEVLHTRHVHIPSLSTGDLGFEEQVIQGFDDKEIDGLTPTEAVAIGRVQVEFVDTPTATEPPDLSRWMDGRWVRSTTGELSWNVEGDGYAIIDTPRTAGVVGFAPDEPIDTGSFDFMVRNPYASVTFTSLDDLPLASSRRVLLTAVARAMNTGMEFSADGSEVAAEGTAPVLVEGVRVEWREQGWQVTPLSHNGEPMGSARQTDFADGAEDETIYWLLER